MQEDFRHEAVPYAGAPAFLSCCASLADGATSRDERLMFVLPAAKVESLRGTLASRDITYIDSDEHVRNPARLLTFLDTFRSGSGEQHCVGIHEPALVGTPPTLAETRFTESLLNSPALASWNLAVLCMYDSTRLDSTARTEMHRSHPSVRDEEWNPAYEPELAAELFAEALPEPPSHASDHEVRNRHLVPVREFVRSNAGELAPDRREDLVLAVDEVITNSVQHGGGRCSVAMWNENGTVVCDVRDAGHITDPMTGRLAPTPASTAGRGLWLANHLTDLVQIRSSHAGTTVRLRIDR